MRDNRPAGATRRDFLAATAGGLAAISMADRFAVRVHAEAEQTEMSDLVKMNAAELSRAIHSKRASAAEVMTAYLDHIDRLNSKVNAIVTLQDRDRLMKQAAERDAQLARGESMGWMHGFPHAAKDLAATKGIRTTWGSPLLDMVPAEDAIFVERLRKNGAILIGKTNAPEFGLGSQTYNSVFGTTLNAFDQHKCAGGSSGGAAVSLALRMVPVADGSDMMGSLRNPAAYNNVIGFRPSYGRVPSSGPELFLGQLSTEGPMGRTVEDVAMLLSVMAGPDSRAPLSIEQDPKVFTEPLKRDFHGTRAVWLGDLAGRLPMEPGVMELCAGALKVFESIGCKVDDQPVLKLPVDEMWESWVRLRHWLVADGLAPLYDDPAKRARMKPEAQWEIENGLKLSALDVFRASVVRSGWYDAIRSVFETYDYLLLPSAQVFPFDAHVHWPAEINGVKMDTYHRWMEVVVPASLLSAPVIGMPVGFNANGLPMGMQIIGRNHADLAVLQVAYAYEQATEWTRKVLPALLKES